MKARAPKGVSSPSSTTKVRTPNATRTATTRAKILNAAIDCLCEVGYHNTSTVLVTERAKVSRGAMLHHFPSKAELILETFAHIRLVRVEAHDTVLNPMSTDREKFLHLIDALWRTFETPAGIARLEIMMGVRCDPEMAAAFGRQHHISLEKHFDRVHKLAEAVGIGDHRKLDPFVMLYIGAMRGMMIESFYATPQDMKDIRAAIAMLKDFQVATLDKLLAEG